ncbi:hypothetical protein U1Q18_051383 [Sarracenia purpurea var. burkii]
MFTARGIQMLLIAMSKDEKNGLKTYWDRRLVKQKTCKARAITTKCPNSAEIVVLKCGELNSHEHPPNQELCRAEEVRTAIKRKAMEHPEQQ